MSGYFVFYTVLLFYAFGHFQNTAKTILFYGETLLCFLYLVGIVWFISSQVRFEAPLVNFAVQNAALLVLGAPYLFLVEKKTGALSTLWNALRKRSGAKEAVAS